MPPRVGAARSGEHPVRWRVSRRPSPAAQNAAQRAIYRVQSELERMVREERATAVALCDRGTLDGLAYWPGAAEAFFAQVGTTRELELARYAAVIHLRTPSADNGYDHSNPIRTETAREALDLDQQIADGWAGHPRRHFVDSTPDFLAKLSRVVELIRAEMPVCCRAHRVPEIGERPGRLEKLPPPCR